MFKIKLDKEKCIGCGTCVAVCVNNFEMDEGGKAKAINEEVESLGCNRMAEENCPVNAIVVRPISDKGKIKTEEQEVKKSDVEEN
jgi:ferredoxin